MVVVLDLPSESATLGIVAEKEAGIKAGDRGTGVSAPARKLGNIVALIIIITDAHLGMSLMPAVNL